MWIAHLKGSNTVINLHPETDRKKKVFADLQKFQNKNP